MDRGTDDRSLSETVEIAVPIAAVWDAITVPDMIERWFFGVRTETTWEVGTPIVHRGEYQGRPYEDHGEVVRFEPPTLLVHTHRSDVGGVPDGPEEVTWSLEDLGRTTRLTISERNLPSEEAKRVSERSWTTVLGNLKALLED